MAIIDCKVGQNSNYYRVYIEYSYTQNIAANTSTITAALKLQQLTDTADFNTVSAVKIGFNIDGQEFSKTQVVNIDDKGDKGYTITLVSGKKTVTHNSSGDKTITFSCNNPSSSLNSSGYGPGSITLSSKSVKLKTIPRSSKINKITNSSGTTINSLSVDNAIRVYYTPTVSSYYHKLVFYVGTSKKKTVNLGKAGTTNKKYYTLSSVPASWMPSAVTGTLKCYLYTYSNSSYSNKIGSSDVDSITINVPDTTTYKPTASLTITEAYNNNLNVYLKGISKPTFKITGKAGSGASISSYSLSGNGVSSTSASTTITLNRYGSNLEYTATVKDSRGRTATAKKNITIYDYAKPVISSGSVSRNSSTQTRVNGKVNASASTVGGKNKVAEIYWYYRLFGQSDWSRVISSSITNNDVTISPTTLNFNQYKTYQFLFRVFDTVGKYTDSKIYTISTSAVPINIAPNNKGVAIGQMSSVTSSTAASKFECNWDMYTSKSIGFTHLWNSSNSPNIFCQWRDGENHDMISRYNDGLRMGIGWSGEHTTTNADGTTTTKQYDTILDLRSPTTSARGELLTNAKTGAYDGKQGVCVSNNGRVYVVGDANAAQKTPGIVFAYNKSKEGTSSIFETAKGELTLDANTITTGNISTGGKLGSTSAYNAVFSMYCKWKDRDDHNLIDRDKDGLTAGIGWGGVHKNSNNTTTTYKTVLNLRGQTVKVTYGSGAGTISDERLKNSFIDLNQYEKFFNNLHPIAYKYNNGNSGRYHIGFGAQSVERALLESGLDNTYFGGILHYPIDNKSEDYNGYDEEYGLIYNEFIALNTHMIQKLKSENEELKNRVSLLEEKLNSVITEIENLKESIKNEA